MMQRWLGLGCVIAAVCGQMACAGEASDAAAGGTTGTTTVPPPSTYRDPGGSTYKHGGAGDSGTAASNDQAGGRATGTTSSTPTMGGGGARPGGPDDVPPACAAAKISAEQQAAKLPADPLSPPDKLRRAFFESADDSNSMGSPALAREILEGGGAPDPATVRSYEFLNYYRVRHAAPKDGKPAIYADAEPDVFDPSSVSLQISLRAPDAGKARRPMSLTLVLDASGSVAGVGIERERALIHALAKKLQAGDVLSVVTWNVERAVLLTGYRVTGSNDKTVLAAAEALRPQGGSDLHGGLALAYQVARQNFLKDGVNRGVVDRTVIAKAAHDSDAEGIYLAGVGFGPALGYSDALMNAVTDAGRGAYVYLDSVAEADRMFGDRFDELLGVAARDVSLKLEVPYYFDIPAFYGESYSTDPNAVEPQHLAPGGQMIFLQRLERCAAGFADAAVSGDPLRVTVKWHDPITRKPLEVASAFDIDVLANDGHVSLHKAEAIVAYAEALKLTGDDATFALSAAHDLVDGLVTGELAGDAELTEIERLLAQHPLYPKAAK